MLSKTLFLSALSLSFGLLVATPPAAAQSVLVDEDFESGDFPGDWPLFGTIPIQWRVSAAGDCGMPSRMAAFNHSSSCTYWATFSTAGLLSTSSFDIPPDRALRIEFDYAQEIDFGPDVIEVRLESEVAGVNPWLVVDGLSLHNDGILRSASFLVSDPSAFVGNPAHVSFWISADTQGNQGLGWMFDNVRVSLEPVAQPFCFGDVPGTCPCLNGSSTGEGCANSTGVGAILSSAGSSVVAADDLQLVVTQARPGMAGLAIQGSTTIQLPFKDGIFCAGNPTDRLEIVSLDAAGSGSTSGSLVTAGGVQPGDSRVYQLWYRDPAVSPCGFGSNFTNALQVDWI